MHSSCELVEVGLFVGLFFFYYNSAFILHLQKYLLTWAISAHTTHESHDSPEGHISMSTNAAFPPFFLSGASDLYVG